MMIWVVYGRRLPFPLSISFSISGSAIFAYTSSNSTVTFLPLITLGSSLVWPRSALSAAFGVRRYHSQKQVPMTYKLEV
jgi:hypothetical protein